MPPTALPSLSMSHTITSHATNYSLALSTDGTLTITPPSCSLLVSTKVASPSHDIKPPTISECRWHLLVPPTFPPSSSTNDILNSLTNFLYQQLYCIVDTSASHSTINQYRWHTMSLPTFDKAS